MEVMMMVMTTTTLMTLRMVMREMRVACLEDAYFFKRLDISFMLLKSRFNSLCEIYAAILSFVAFI